MLEIQYVEGKGRGVFARKRFDPGEVIERAPVVIIPAPDQLAHVEQTPLGNYCFVWRQEFALPLGYGALYNHSHRPNACFDLKFEDLVIEFRAARLIEPGEEILIHYNQDYPDHPLWFDCV